MEEVRQRYFLLDEGRVGGADVPSGNLVSALIVLETNRDQLRAPECTTSSTPSCRRPAARGTTSAGGCVPRCVTWPSAARARSAPVSRSAGGTRR